MDDRRTDTRILCADLVEVCWRSEKGRKQKQVANLEDISASGACLQIDAPIPVNTVVRIECPRGELTGTIRYCHFREIGYFLGVQFEPGCRWTQKMFRPMHMLDPSALVKRKKKNLLPPKLRLMPSAPDPGPRA